MKSSGVLRNGSRAASPDSTRISLIVFDVFSSTGELTLSGFLRVKKILPNEGGRNERVNTSSGVTGIF